MADWSKEEVQLVIKSYFEMLRHELRNEKYIKKEFRLKLLPLLDQRSEGSIEFKHQNISAVLAEDGIPFITGYKPRDNYQQLLREEVTNFLLSNKSFWEQEFETFATLETVISPITIVDFEEVLENEPVKSLVKESPAFYFTPVKKNYLEQEQRNSALGAAGESFIIEYERWRLTKAGKENLADEIEWTSKELGDGAGYDILSKNEDGTDRYIEVKTTKLSKETPILISKNEIEFSKQYPASYYLYRVYNFSNSPHLFIRNGSFTDFCELAPQSFKGYFI